MTFRTPSRATSSLTLALVLLFATTLLGQPGGLKAPATQQIARRVSQMIEANHISRSQIDDKVSARFLDTFIKQMDSQKLYFLQSDIDQFKGLKTQLDDLVKSGNTEFAASAWKLFIQRLDERMAVAHKWIDAQHDFTVEESMAVDPKETPYAADVAELDERWRKRVKFDLVSLKLDKTADDEARKRLHRRYKTIRESFAQTEPDEVVEMYLTSLCEAFDPHSSYMSPRTLDDFRIQMELKLDGIGAALRVEDGFTVVQSIVPGGAAAADGRLKPGDKITAVSNDKGEMIDVVEMKLTKVVDYIRGKRGTKVKLQLVRAEGAGGELIELVRQTVPLTASEVKGEIIPAGDRVKGAVGRIGVVRIPSFYRDFRGAEDGVENFKSTSRDVRKVIDDFTAKGGVDLILIDLRTNGGGALTEAIEVSGLFIDEGPVVQVKNSRDKVSQLNDEEAGTVWNKPLVVVTNRLSASASEIFAGVIKDYRRGIIIGDRTTHGKGTVQSVMNVGKSGALDFLNPGPEHGALKLTIQQFYRVNGDSTQNLGVPSDVTLPSLLDNMDLGESYLDNAMPFDRVAAARMTPYKMISPEIVSALRDGSRKRVSENPEFQKTEGEIAKFLDRKSRKAVSLNEAELLKERSDEENKVKEKIEAEESGEGPVFADNAYNTELLTISLDYLALLRETATAKK
jgi:carboxyl-terminal processing protease